ncbi:MAG: ferrous iron transport protein B [Oscillospiraceae bacterium]|nr:ferrous iron transport protein B [Oscillospiraceae bacterium]
MGLTNSSTGHNASDNAANIKKKTPSDKVIALAGNPNVGKSTVFNALTGMNQHTGNWPGKTVASAQGYLETKNGTYVLVDIPGTYSLMAHSAEEEVARNFICFENVDAVVVVCDATCLERNLNLVLQTMEISKNVIVCVNLMDEAKRKNISVNLKLLSEKLGVPVVGVSARKKKTLSKLVEEIENFTNINYEFKIEYDEKIENAINMIEPILKKYYDEKINCRWLSLRLLDKDDLLIKEFSKYTKKNIFKNKKIASAVKDAEEYLTENGITPDILKDMIVSTLLFKAEEICKDAVTYENEKYDLFDRRLDKLLTSKLTGYPVMLILLALVFYITISGANYPSMLLSDLLFSLQDKMMSFFTFIKMPESIKNMLVLGIYRTLAWIVSVMLPPMAIFFPLFTLLEDSGYLPRIAYNLDKPFKKCCACGKQALTMCMGFGCNAAGVVGCRIIDSPRERLLAILTNNFVPCNGRFPTLISIITMFFIGTQASMLSTAKSALFLTFIILLGITFTFLSTFVLSKTVLKGVTSSFTLELPPYRKPQIGKVIVRSIFDRTLFVLGRAAAVAAPAGLVIYLAANTFIDGNSILKILSDFLDPFARLMGLDGVILIAFILGFPANEIVLPIVIMAYTASGTLTEASSITAMKELFVSNGWNSVTAMCTMLFSLFHWPCSTTIITVKKETQSIKWTVLAFLIPTATGILVCMIFANLCRIFM